MSKHRRRNTDRDRIQAEETGGLIIAHDRKTDRMYEVRPEDNSIWSLDDGKRIDLKESLQLFLALTPQAFWAFGSLIKEALFGERERRSRKRNSDRNRISNLTSTARPCKLEEHQRKETK